MNDVNQYNDEGQKHGLWKEVRHKIMHTGEYINGKKEGIWQTYIILETFEKRDASNVTYHNNIKHGPAATYDNMGRADYYGEYVNGTMQGIWTQVTYAEKPHYERHMWKTSYLLNGSGKEVEVQFDEQDRATTITYNNEVIGIQSFAEDGSINFYEDNCGNWYDSRFLKFECPHKLENNYRIVNDYKVLYEEDFYLHYYTPAVELNLAERNPMVSN